MSRGQVHYFVKEILLHLRKLNSSWSGNAAMRLMMLWDSIESAWLICVKIYCKV